MSAALVLVESLAPGVTQFTLNRPDKRNALSIELVDVFLAALTSAEADAQTRVMILTGAGPAFCAGLDLAEAADAAKAHRSSELIAAMLQRIATSRLVTIAVVRGAAIAGGAGVMSACDFVLAEESAQIGYPETRRGLVAALVMTFLRRQLRERDARHLLLTGAMVSARRAVEIGLANDAVTSEQLMARARQLANDLLAGGPEAVVHSKQLLAELWPSPLAADLANAMKIHRLTRGSAEIQEGIAAFQEKRPPNWAPRP